MSFTKENAKTQQTIDIRRALAMEVLETAEISVRSSDIELVAEALRKSKGVYYKEDGITQAGVTDTIALHWGKSSSSRIHTVPLKLDEDNYEIVPLIVRGNDRVCIVNRTVGPGRITGFGVDSDIIKSTDPWDKFSKPYTLDIFPVARWNGFKVFCSLDDFKKKWTSMKKGKKLGIYKPHTSEERRENGDLLYKLKLVNPKKPSDTLEYGFLFDKVSQHCHVLKYTIAVSFYGKKEKMFEKPFVEFFTPAVDIVGLKKNAITYDYSM